MATELVDAFSLLKIANTTVLPQFLHDCVDDLIKTKTANFDSYNSDIEWTIEDFNKAKRAIQNYYRQCIIQKQEIQCQELSGNIQEEIKNCFEIRKDDIYGALVKDHLIIDNDLKLAESFDWHLKWILGSSKLASIREPVVQIDLNCLQKGAEGEVQRSTVNFEANLEKVDLLIGELQRALEEANS